MHKKLMNHFSSLTGIDFHIFDVGLKEFEEFDTTFCSRCPKHCDHRRTHLYGCYESVRWDNHYIYYCPMDFIFVALPIIGEYNILGSGVIAGPILMGDPMDYDQSYGIPHMPTARVNDLAHVASAVFSTQKQTIPEERTGDFLNALYREMELLQPDDSYPFYLEEKLQSAIVNGDEAAARENLNRLLGEIFFRSNGDIATIKARALELLVLLSRSAIEGGADTKQIFALNDNYIQEIDQFDTVEKLSFWLSGIINRFVSYVFEFGDIKHSLTLREIIGYIRNNYMHKISLDDIAEHVFLSKSHISKIFNAEMNMSISAFVNKVRIEKSKRLLLDPNLTIAEVANLSGFEDQSYFTKQFKLQIGIAPKHFREKQHLQSQQKKVKN